MKTNSRAFIALGVAAALAISTPVAADRIIAHFPDGHGGEVLQNRIKRIAKQLAEQLAPATPGKNQYGHRFFAGRILMLLPPVNPSAPLKSPDHWPKIVFEAYGKGGTPKSRKPVILSILRLMSFGGIQSTIDTAADFSRLLSNRHEIMGVEFGSRRHLQAVFAALDPDGSMGLSAGGAAGPSSGLKEGALMIFGKQGVTRDLNARHMQSLLNPINPIYALGPSTLGEAGSTGLPARMLDEYARSKRYPGYEPAYGGMAKAALRIFYTLSIATPDLTSPRYRTWAKRYQFVGRSTFDALSRALDYHPTDADSRKFLNDDRPFMPLTVEEVRRAALDVLADGPVVPVPAISHQGRLIGTLLKIINKDESLAPVARKILERQLAPEPGEASAVTTLYETDRETYRGQARDYMFGRGELVGPAGRALAWVGWGKKKKAEQIVDVMVTWALQGVGGNDLIALLRMVARPEKFTRKDRRKFAVVAANELDRQIGYIRTDLKKGFGGVAEDRFIKLWDAEDE